MKLNEILLNESSEFDDMTPEAAAKLYNHTMKLIKKLSDDKGWYGGVSGTDLYNRDWKKDLTVIKKRAALLKKRMTNKAINESYVKYVYVEKDNMKDVDEWLESEGLGYTEKVNFGPKHFKLKFIDSLSVGYALEVDGTSENPPNKVVREHGPQTRDGRNQNPFNDSDDDSSFDDNYEIFVFPLQKSTVKNRTQWEYFDLDRNKKLINGTKHGVKAKLQKEFPNKTITISYHPRKFGDLKFDI